MKPETVFRVDKVIPFLKKLKNTTYFPIQQLAICGDPDFLLCTNGLFIGLELKKDEDEKPRKLQEYKLNEIERTGGIALVASPDNWERIAQTLLKLDRGE